MKTEFKEKTFEKYFSCEIARLTNITFSPDQCDEHFLGFDDAFLLPFPLLVGLAPYVRRSRWARRTGITLDILDDLLPELIERMPPFRFNLFVQYKRPEYLKTRGAKEWAAWHSPYYRIDITPHQQTLLENIDALSVGRAAVVYAAPAFWSSTDLWTHVESQKVIENSNIASCGLLAGHHCYTYAARGHGGHAHSEPVQVSSRPLDEIISAGLEANEPIDAKEHIIKMAKIVEEAIGMDDLSGQLFRLARGPELIRGRRRSRLIEALETLQTFSDVFEISSYALD